MLHKPLSVSLHGQQAPVVVDRVEHLQIPSFTDVYKISDTQQKEPLSSQWPCASRQITNSASIVVDTLWIGVERGAIHICGCIWKTNLFHVASITTEKSTPANIASTNVVRCISGDWQVTRLLLSTRISLKLPVPYRIVAGYANITVRIHVTSSRSEFCKIVKNGVAGH